MRDALIAYSLGNFVFDMDFSRATQEGAVLELTFWGGDLKAARLVPVVIGADFAPRAGPRPAGPGDPRPGVGREWSTAAAARTPRLDRQGCRSHSHITAPTRPKLPRV